MPRRSSIPSYQLHKATGQARITINGKDRYLGKFGTPESRTEYEAIVRQLILDRARGEVQRQAIISAGLTINELVPAYLQHVSAYYQKDGKPTSEVANIKIALKPMREQYGFDLVESFDTLKLTAIQEYLVGKRVKRDQINRRVHRIRRCFKWAVSRKLVSVRVYQDLLTVEPLKKGRTKAPEGEGRTSVPLAHIEAILPRVERRIAAMIQLQLHSGARPGEIVEMTTGGIDMSGATWVYVPARFKSEHHRKARRIYLGPKCQAILQQWLRTGRNEPLFQPREAVAEQAAKRRDRRITKLWPSHVASQARKRMTRPRRELGDTYSVASYRRHIARACELVGIPAFSPHSLRHTAAEIYFTRP
jgi:integrase